MTSKKIVLHFSKENWSKPIVYRLVKDFNLSFNILKAQITPREEGILVLALRQIREKLNVKIFVDTDADVRFIRRLSRDIRDRGRDVRSVIDQYMGVVRLMHLEFVEPSKRYADIIIPRGGHNAVAIDMVVVNLYPFKETVAKPDVTPESARGNIDIGGPCMVRASAKNFIRVASVTDPDDYGRIIAELEKNAGCISLAARFKLARKAFAHTASYDRAISGYLAKSTLSEIRKCYKIE